MSSCQVPVHPNVDVDSTGNRTAPSIRNDRFSTVWTDDGVNDYRDMVSPLLPEIRNTWGNTGNKSDLSLLLSSTYSILTLGCKATNKVNMLGVKKKIRTKTDPILTYISQISVDIHFYLGILFYTSIVSRLYDS